MSSAAPAPGEPQTPDITLALAATALPALIAYNLPPSATFFNQAAALVGWGAWLAWLATTLPTRVARPRGGLAALLGALGVMALASLAAPLWTGQPWSLALSSAGLIAAAALTACTAAAAGPAGLGASAFRSFCFALLAAGLITTMIGAVQVFAPDLADGDWIARSGLEGRSVGNLRQPNHVGSLLLWSVIAVIWLGEARALPRSFTAAFTVALLFGAAQTASRTAGLGVLLLALWGLADRRLSRPTRLLLLLTPVIFAATWFGLTAWAHETQQVFGGDAQMHKVDISSSRFGIWSNTLALIKAHPWAGVGWGEFNFAWSLTPFPGRPIAFFDHTHNLFLQLAVELGLPLAALVVGLLGWALWRACTSAQDLPARPGDPGVTAPRAAIAMVVMILIHSQLEYPLWYAYFLLPAAFAFGIAVADPAGATTAQGAAPATPSARPATRPLLLAAMLLMLGGMASAFDYMRVVAIFAPPPGAASLADRITAGQHSVFFSHHGDYAAVTTPERPAQALPGAIGAMHYLLDARLMMAWAQALEDSGDTERARHVAQRLKEFRNEQSTAFFAPCQAGAEKPPQPLPFQCSAPTRAFDYLDFR